MVSQFLGRDLERILRREPDLLPWHAGWGWGVVTVGPPLRLQRRVQEGGKDPSPCMHPCSNTDRPVLRALPCPPGVADSLAILNPEGSLVSGMKCTALEILSTNVRMVVFLSNGGRPVTKSTAMCDWGHQRVKRGLRGPASS